MIFGKGKKRGIEGGRDACHEIVEFLINICLINHVEFF